MKFHATPLAGLTVIEPTVFGDARGFFMEVHHERRFAEAGIHARFVQDNHSGSVQNTVRGLHYQIGHPQGKLVRCIFGEIFDVAVDLRRGSATFGRWHGATLSAENRLQLWIPPGFAHGFAVTSERAEVVYKCTDIYFPEGERALRWNDPEIGIDWPVRDPILSDKDAAAPLLGDIPETDLFAMER